MSTENPQSAIGKFMSRFGEEAASRLAKSLFSHGGELVGLFGMTTQNRLLIYTFGCAVGSPDETQLRSTLPTQTKQGDDVEPESIREVIKRAVENFRQALKCETPNVGDLLLPPPRPVPPETSIHPPATYPDKNPETPHQADPPRQLGL